MRERVREEEREVGRKGESKIGMVEIRYYVCVVHIPC